MAGTPGSPATRATERPPTSRTRAPRYPALCQRRRPSRLGDAPGQQRIVVLALGGEIVDVYVGDPFQEAGGSRGGPVAGAVAQIPADAEAGDIGLGDDRQPLWLHVDAHVDSGAPAAGVHSLCEALMYP